MNRRFSSLMERDLDALRPPVVNDDAGEEATDVAAVISEENGGSVRDVPCDQCGSSQFLTLFEKDSSRDESFQVVRCVHCDLVQVNPQPDAAAVAPYYEASYFEKRTDRGYDNYFSGELKQQIRRVYEQNLNDLGFFEYEESCLSDAWFMQHCEEQAGAETEHRDYRPRALDAGCAAGYFVEFLQDRGWNSQGVELSRAAAKFGIDELGLNILIADFLTSKRLPKESYDLLTFWASIEHMHSPRRVFERCAELLKPGGRLILSTCRYGLLARWRGEQWRFMNVPEHLFFFSLDGIRNLAADCGFRTVASVTYGSGLTGKKNASLFYRAAKAVADPLVKRTAQGDMMALHFVKD